ncbi:hypothetical protein [Sphingomonas paeninsulae]|uniref:hypothetical protein n=1 Tax=Sphingomonas paeninsulae TaxID=2319844 RepID=UPI0013CEA902|nr:hypothetical protein [Sphingomonas paeninsulae]
MARLMRGRQVGVIVVVPQSGIIVGTPGSPLVNGAVGGGIALPIKGLTAGYVMKEGQPLSIIHNSRRFLHWFAGDYTADGSGSGATNIYPPLRTALTNNDVIEIAKPYIEGSLSADSDRWSKQAAARNPISFTVTEDA